MTQYTLPTIAGIEPVVFIESSLQGIRAYGIAFDDEADMVAETDSRQFIDYCRACVTHAVTAEMLASLNLPTDAVWDTLSAVGLNCHCDD